MRFARDNPISQPAPGRTGAVALALLFCAGAALARPAQPEVLGPAGITVDAPAPVRRVLVDDDGRRRTVEIAGLKDGALQTRDPAGRPRSIALASIVAMFPAIDDGAPKAASAWANLLNLDGLQDGQLYLTDGQSIPGRPAATAGPVERVDWIASAGHLRGMKFSVPLDRIAAATLAGSTGTPTVTRVKDAPRRLLDAAPAKDTVVFANGDKAEGFVTRIGEVVSIEAGAKTSDFPSTRIDYVRLANPPAAAPGPCVWLSDGSVVALLAPRATDEGTLSAGVRDAVGTPTATWSWNEIDGYTTDAARFTALAALKPRAVADPSRRWSDPPRIADIAAAPLGAAEIDLPGPMSVEWTLARPARRLSMRLVLPEACRRWGDAVVVVELGSGPVREITRERLSGDRPVVDVNAALDAPKGGTLRIRLEAGENGPIQDRVLLQQAIVINDAGK